MDLSLHRSQLRIMTIQAIHNDVAWHGMCAVGRAFGIANAPAPAAAADPVEPGSFVWHDLLTKDVAVPNGFTESYLGWRFEDTKRGDRPYVIARAGPTTQSPALWMSARIADAGAQWLSFMAVADVDKTVAFVQSGGGKVLAQPRDVPLARAAVVADPQGAPLGLAQLRRNIPDPRRPTASHFFWQEYLARDAATGARVLQTTRRDTTRRSPTHIWASSTTSYGRHAARWSLPASGNRHGRRSRTGCPTYWSDDPRCIGGACDLHWAVVSSCRRQPSVETARSSSSPIPPARCSRCRSIRSEASQS